MTQPDAIEAMSRQLRDDVDAVWLRILAEQDELARVWGDLPGPVRVHRLLLMQAHIRDLADSADELAAQWVTSSAHTAYEAGAWATATAAATGAAFTTADLDAVTFLAQDLMGDLLAATQGVRESVKTLVRDLTRDWIRNKLYTGLTAEQAGTQLAATLAERGVSAITYANGRRVGLSTYTDMAVRTKTAEAYQIGGFNQGDRLGIEWWEVMDGVNCVVAGTRFLPYGDLTTIVRASFSGRAYQITARTPLGPNTLTVGPNHPVLTQRGWVRAHLLTERDQLVYDPRTQDSATLAELHLEQVPVVEDVFAAASELGPVAARTPSGEDLHGDAVFCHGEVDVVTVQRGLLVERDASLSEHGREGDLMRADADGAAVAGDRRRRNDLGWSNHATGGFIGSCGPGSPFIGPCPVVPASQRLATADGQPLVLEVGVDLFGTQTKGSGNLAGPHSAPVEELDVVAGQEPPADSRAWSGAEPALGVVLRVEDDTAVLADRGTAGSLVELAHGVILCPVETIVHGVYHGVVFDATTTTGAFNADGFIVKNCGWTSHDDPQSANGMIVDTNTARSYPISHPSCRRSTSPRPDIASKDEARRAKPTTTEAQRADQAQAEAARAAAQTRMPRRVSLDRQVARQRGVLNLRAGTLSAAQIRHQALTA